jgi:hypothetical protein
VVTGSADNPHLKIGDVESKHRSLVESRTFRILSVANEDACTRAF